MFRLRQKLGSRLASAAAPGGPSHVLLTDTVAEHIPVVTWRFGGGLSKMSGGSIRNITRRVTTWTFAGVCKQAGAVIAFSPTAIVWHHRRFTLRAFRKQQEGYGEANRFCVLSISFSSGQPGQRNGVAKFTAPPRFSWFLGRPIIYHGIFADGFFQSIYPTPQSEVAAYLSSIEWFALTIFLSSAWVYLFRPLRIVPYLMLGGTLCVALSYMVRARIEPRFDTIHSRLLVMFLAFAQPLVRGWSRYFTWLHFKRTPGSVIAQHEKPPPGKKFGRSWGRLAYWNDEGKDRHSLLREIFTLLDQENWRYSIDTGWQEWDIQIYGNFWWSIILRTVTEYHGDGKCLTRVQLRYPLRHHHRNRQSHRPHLIHLSFP